MGEKCGKMREGGEKMRQKGEKLGQGGVNKGEMGEMGRRWGVNGGCRVGSELSGRL